MWHSIRLLCLSVVILLIFASFGGAELINSDVLAQSKIKKSSFKQIFRDINKMLPSKLRKCSIIVTNINLLKSENGRVWEDWTVKVCEEQRIYYIDTFTPKGECSVMPKDEAMAKERNIWDAAKKHRDESFWINKLPHIGEIMNEKGRREDGGLEISGPH